MDLRQKETKTYESPSKDGWAGVPDVRIVNATTPHAVPIPAFWQELSSVDPRHVILLYLGKVVLTNEVEHLL